MTSKEQIKAFDSDVRKVLKRYRSEFDLSFEMAVGVLEVIKSDLLEELRNISNEDDDDEDDDSWRTCHL